MIYRITKYPLEPMPLKMGLNIISIEHQNLFFEIVQSMRLTESKLIFSRDDEIDETRKYINFIGDISSEIDLEKMYSKDVNKLLISSLDENQLRELNELDSKINLIYTNAIVESNLPISITLDFDLESLVKFKKIKIDVPIAETAYDKIQGIVDVASELNDNRLLVFTNVYQYLNQGQIDYLAENLKLQERYVLFLERSSSRLNANEVASSYFIDQDFVQF